MDGAGVLQYSYQQDFEFTFLIRFSPDLSERWKRQIVAKRIFTYPTGADTISQPQPLVYALRLCHYADFHVRFNRVTHG